MSFSEVERSIHIADDDPGVLNVLTEAVPIIVAKLPGKYVIRPYGDGQEAYEGIQADGNEPALLITDRNMPRMNGEELMRSAQGLWLTRHPLITVSTIMVSGGEADWDPKDPDFGKRLDALGTRLIVKPIHIKVLREAIMDCLT